MKRRIILFLGLTFLVAVIAFNFQLSTNQNKANELTSMNIEAMKASAEESICIFHSCENLVFYCEYADHTPSKEPEICRY